VAQSAALQLRDAQLSDCPAVSALCLRSKAHWGYSEEFLRQSREDLRLTPERLTAWRVRVASSRAEPNQLVGVSAFSVDATQARPSAELELLFVEPRAIGLGVGGALLDEVLRALQLRGVESLWILSDPFAEAFYLRRGATRAALRESSVVPGRVLPWLHLPV